MPKPQCLALYRNKDQQDIRGNLKLTSEVSANWTQKVVHGLLHCYYLVDDHVVAPHSRQLYHYTFQDIL